MADDNEDKNRLVHTIAEVAKALRVGRDVVYDLAAQGKLDLIKVGRQSRITDQSLKRFMADSLKNKPILKRRRGRFNPDD